MTTNASPPTTHPTTIIPLLPLSEQNTLLPLLHTFTTRHQSHHRPTVLVTSGGTATDLEVNAVRFLDNFSTGHRGAVSVEEFLKRGYAVIHLWRRGSAAPYTRVLNGLLTGSGEGGGQQLGFDAMGRLFEGQMDSVDDDDDVHGTNDTDNDRAKHDPWLTSTSNTASSSRVNPTKKNQGTIHDDDDDDYAYSNNDRGETKLSRRILNSTKLRCKLRERADVLQKGLLLTVPFRTVEEYLAKLQLCAEAMQDCRSLGLIYLAAAVSDFYIPLHSRSEHKIQSRDYGLSSGGNNTATAGEDHAGGHRSAIEVTKDGAGIDIHLSPVPKCISLLRESWAPDAFCISFKLETDKNILYDKAKMAMERYGVHMVIGNLLSTRHEKVWVLQKRNEDEEDYKHDYAMTAICSNDDDPLFEMLELSKGANGTNAGSSSSDELEESIISHIVERHFSYIATNYPISSSNNNKNSSSSTDDEGNQNKSPIPPAATTPLMAGAEAAARHNLHLQEKKSKLQKELYWKKVQDVGLQLVGHAVGMYLTYALSSGLQRRMR